MKDHILDPSFLDKTVEADINSYPMNLAYKAMQIQDEKIAQKYPLAIVFPMNKKAKSVYLLNKAELDHALGI